MEGRSCEGSILLLLPDLKTLHRSYDNGICMNKVQVGGLGGGPDRKVVYQNITLDKEDAEILHELHEKGVEIIFQTIPEDSPMSFQEAYNRFQKYGERRVYTDTISDNRFISGEKKGVLNKGVQSK